MKFRTLPRDVVKRMIHGIPDILTPLSDQRIAEIKRMPCPRCRSAMSPQFYAQEAFERNDPLPRVMAYCQDCGATIDPRTNIVLDTGDPRLVDDALPIIQEHDD